MECGRSVMRSEEHGALPSAKLCGVTTSNLSSPSDPDFSLPSLNLSAPLCRRVVSRLLRKQQRLIHAG